MTPGTLLPAGAASAERSTRPGPATLARKSDLAGKPVKGHKPSRPDTEVAQDFSSALAQQLKPSMADPDLRVPGKTRSTATEDSKDAAAPAPLDLAVLGLSPLPALAGIAQTDAAPSSSTAAQALSAAPAAGPALSPQPGAQPIPSETPLSAAAELRAPLAADSASDSPSAPMPGKAAARPDKGQAPAAAHQAGSPDQERSAAGLNEKPALQSPDRESTSQQGHAPAQPAAPVHSPQGGPAQVLAGGLVSSPASPPPAPTPTAAGLHHALLPQAPGSAAWQQALGQQLVFMSQTGLHSAQLQLHPLELGPLQVDLRLVDGELRAHFKAEQASVREVVEAALPQLRSALNEQGLSLGQAQVGAGSSQAQDRRESAAPTPQGLGRKAVEIRQPSTDLARSLTGATSAGPGRLHTWA